MGETTLILNTLLLRQLVGHTLGPVAFFLGVRVVTFHGPVACIACVIRPST